MKDIRNWNGCKRINGSWIDTITGQSIFHQDPSSNGYLVEWAYKMYLNFMKENSDTEIRSFMNQVQWNDSLSVEPGKKILIIGAGPSTALLKPEDYEDVDEIWTCNHFFKHSVADLNVTLANLGNEVDFEDPDLISFLEKNKECKIGISNLIKGDRRKKMQAFQKKYRDRFGMFMPYWVGKGGEVPKMVVFAASQLPSEVRIIGMDGHTKSELDMNISGNVFEPGKPLKKSKKDWNMQRRQFAFLFGLVTHMSARTMWKNLGARYSKNQVRFLNEKGEFK
jgi:hypothetical protein